MFETALPLKGSIDHALLYLIGGVAWAHDKYTLSDAPFPESASGSETRVGGLLGGGIEYAFTPNWSGKLEYNFMDFGSTTPTFCSSNTPDFFETSCAPLGVKQQIHTVTVGLNYKFDWR